MCVGMWREQERWLDHLELCYNFYEPPDVGVGNWTWPSGRAESVLDHWAISPFPFNVLVCMTYFKAKKYELYIVYFLSTFIKIFSNAYFGAGKMIQCIQVSGADPDNLSSNPWVPYSERRKSTLASCSLMSIYVDGTYASTCIHMHTNIYVYIHKYM